MSNENVTIKGKKVYVDGALAGEITGHRYTWRGEPLGSYDFKPADGWTSPWAPVVRDLKGHGGFPYFADAVKEIREAAMRGEIARAALAK